MANRHMRRAQQKIGKVNGSRVTPGTNADKEPIEGVTGVLGLIPRQYLRTHTIECDCPGCNNHLNLQVPPDAAAAWEHFKQIGITCNVCGQRFRCGRRMVELA